MAFKSVPPGKEKGHPKRMPAVLKSLHSSRLLQSKRYEFCGNISANPCPFRKTAAAPKILCSHNQETGIKCEPVHVILSSPQGDAPMRPIQAYVPKERILPSREIVKEGQALTGLRVLKFDGAVAPRVLKFDSGYAAEGCGGRF